ncbi:MAG TPA: ABC transporter substrate-binding protein, partial [Microthrixaceae bacterium]|nr:ABC transporter substrate-binding protein [Microthrixaceae bacterium]
MGERLGHRATRRVVGAGLAALLVLGVAACGDDGSDEGAGGDDSSETTTAPSADLLGTPNPATGEPVVVGLLTTGGDCAQCSEGGGLEEPAAVATVAWINEYLGGVGGRPIELQTCNNELDPSKAIDCANELISAGAVAVITGADSTVTGWETLHEAGIPVISFATTEQSYLDDPDSTFVLQDGHALTVEFPIGVAEEVDTEDVSIIVIDLPAATDIYASDDTKATFEEAGLDPQLVPAPLGTIDMTPQAQQVVKENPEGAVNIVGHDAFCIPAINGLIATGFKGTIATISFCVTDAMREALASSGVLEGMRLGASDALGDKADPSTEQYNAVLDKYATSDIPRDSSSPSGTYSSFAALAIGTAGLEGEVTPASVIAAMKSMDNAVLPGTGGRQFRCNGKA